MAIEKVDFKVIFDGVLESAEKIAEQLQLLKEKVAKINKESLEARFSELERENAELKEKLKNI